MNIDVEKLICKCVPGGDICDPQEIADSIREYFKSLSSPSSVQPDGPRSFKIAQSWPINDLPPQRDSIPWEIIAPHHKQAFANHSQTLEELNRHGGIDAMEAVAVIEDKRYFDLWPYHSDMLLNKSYKASAIIRLDEICKSFSSPSDVQPDGPRSFNSVCGCQTNEAAAPDGSAVPSRAAVGEEKL